MVLVDTSVLIDWLKGRDNIKTASFDNILKVGKPFGISALTYQEVLQGAKDVNEYEKLRLYLGTQKIFHVPNMISFFDIVKATEKRGLHAVSAIIFPTEKLWEK